MSDYSIHCCKEEGNGGGGGDCCDCPFALTIKEEGRTYTDSGGGPFYWDIQTSTSLSGFASYNSQTGICSILLPGTYRLDLTLVTFIENANVPFDFISIITKEGTNFLMNNHNTPNGTDSPGNSHSHRVIVVRPVQIPYQICWIEIIKEVPPNDTLQLIGRLTNFSVTRLCEETPAEVNVEFFEEPI